MKGVEDGAKVEETEKGNLMNNHQINFYVEDEGDGDVKGIID